MDPRHQALLGVLAALGVGAGVGIGGRALLGSNYLFGRRPPKQLPDTTTDVPIPYPRPAVEEEEEESLPKLANQTLGQRLNEGIGSLAKMLPGAAAQTPSEVPWQIAGTTLAGAGGLAGGYKLMDWFLDAKRKRDLDEEIAQAREKYRQALTNQYAPKMAGVSDQLDQLAETAEKRAADLVDTFVTGPAKYIYENSGDARKGVNLYGGLAAALAALSAYGGYKYTRDRSTEALLEKAVKRRSREQAARRPAPLYAVPMT